MSKMMKPALLAFVALGAAAAAMTLDPTQAQAQGDVLELHVVDGGEGKLVVASSKNGVTFIKGKEMKVFRAFKSTRSAMKGDSPDWFVLRDVDSDGTVDVVGAGAPAFVVTGAGAPVFNIPRGCGQFHLADFAADKSQDILCRNGTKIEVVTHDGQKLWEYSVKGLKLGLCNFGDLNGDLKADIECEILGKDAFMRLSGNGNDLGQVESAQLDAAEDDNPGHVEAMANLLGGQETFDLNGDGTAEESILLDGDAIVVRSKSNPKALGRYEIGKATSALIADIDDDNALDIVVGGPGKVLIIDSKGALKATLNTDPKNLKRKTDVQVSRINANNLEDDAPATNKAAVEKGLGKLSACYDGNVRKNPFTRVGNAVFALDVDKSGKVSKVERLHNALDDKAVEGCLTKALKSLAFPKALGPGAVVTITLEFGFVDE